MELQAFSTGVASPPLPWLAAMADPKPEPRKPPGPLKPGPDHPTPEPAPKPEKPEKPPQGDFPPPDTA